MLHRFRSRISAAFLGTAIVVVLLAMSPGVLRAQTSAAESGEGKAGKNKRVEDRKDKKNAEKVETYLDEVTVTATQTETKLRDTAGTVSVITADQIADQMIETGADLVRFEPGVYIENNVTRLGLNGFNIRGIGGNRVLTQVDGVRSAEQFDFGPVSVHQQSVDLDTLRSVEIVRSAGSALYGSDALGGVVSLFTKDPSDYLGSDTRHLGAKATYDGRSDETSLNLATAAAWEGFQMSLFVSSSDGSEADNQGEVGGEGIARDQPNPQEREGLQALGKVTFDVSEGNAMRVSLEISSSDARTNALSSRGTQALGPVMINTLSAWANDEQGRSRIGLGQTLIDHLGLSLLTWDVYGQDVDTDQELIENRSVSVFGPPNFSTRTGTVEFEQFTLSTTVRGQNDFQLGSGSSLLLSFGASYALDEFDMLRERVEFNNVTGAEVPSFLVFPTKWFPRSDTSELGAYVQGEIRWNRFTLIPGVRYDRFDLDADENDRVFLESGGLPPVDFDDGAVSPKLGLVAQINKNLTVTAQYAAGFRAPPYSTVNTGFTNLAGGYQTLANPGLDPETSDNFELGLRGSFGRTSVSINGFSNQYDDFIELQVTGFNPVLNVIEFQSINLTEVEIKGIELRGESRLGDNFLLRFAYADIEGNDVTGDEDVALTSVPPNEGSLGLRYFANSGRWSLDGSVRVAENASQTAVGDGGFAPDSYEVFDLIGFINLTDGLTLRVGVMNLSDETYFEWWNVRGRSANDPRLGLYTSPGRNVLASLGWSW